MAHKSTFIKLDRKILSWRWYKNANTFRVFLHLLLEANIIDIEFENIVVKRGEKVSSYEKIALDLGLTVQQTRTAILHLKSTGELTTKKYPKFQVFSIVNYDLYQSDQQAKWQSINSQSTGNQQQSKNKRIKEDKIDIKDLIDKSEFSLDKPNAMTQALIDSQYIGSDDLYVDEYNAMFRKLIKDYSFEITRSCMWYFIKRFKQQSTDGVGNKIENKFAYFKTAMKNSARRLKREQAKNKNKSYDLDEFFEAAMERSYKDYDYGNGY